MQQLCCLTRGKVTVNANIIIDTFDTNKIVAKESEQKKTQRKNLTNASDKRH